MSKSVGHSGTINIVVLDATNIMLKTIDNYDCLLATHGDPAVPEHYRRGLFGLFQLPENDYPPRIHALAAKYANARGVLHAVLFVFREPRGAVLDYQLQQFTAWNPTLIDEARARPVLNAIASAIPIHPF
jgi:hypothetical protein